MAFTIYALPAMVALLTKLGILVYDRLSNIRSAQSRLFVLMLIGFSIQNVAEATFFLQGTPGTADHTHAGTWWFSAAIVAVALLLHLAIATAAPSKDGATTPFNARSHLLLYVPVVVLQLLLWKTQLLITGFEPMKYTITKIPGPLYLLLEVYLVSYLGGAIGLFVHGATRHDVKYRKLQSRILLLGFVPLAALALAVIVLQRFDFRGFNATVTLPFASTFLLLVAAYAVYRYRLIDVAFYIPWSDVRKRRTELYTRIQEVAADFQTARSPSEMLRQLSETLGCRVALIGGPHPWLATPRMRNDGEVWGIADFPDGKLHDIERVVTINEMADQDPELHALMQRHKVGVIVPFRTHSTAPAYCLLLDLQFNEQIYSSLDFKMVERLFAAMAQRFFEDFLLVRSQLDHMKDELSDTTRNLIRTEQSVVGVQHKVAATRKQNERLREEVARLRRASFKLVTEHGAATIGRAKTLDAYLAEREREAVISALQRAHGKRPAAARHLGIPLHTLNRLIERYRIDPDGLGDS